MYHFYTYAKNNYTNRTSSTKTLGWWWISRGAIYARIWTPDVQWDEPISHARLQCPLWSSSSGRRTSSWGGFSSTSRIWDGDYRLWWWSRTWRYGGSRRHHRKRWGTMDDSRIMTVASRIFFSWILTHGRTPSICSTLGQSSSLG